MKKITANLSKQKLELTTGGIIWLSLLALFGWLVSLMPFMSDQISHITRIGSAFVIISVLITLAYLLRRFNNHGMLMSITSSIIGVPLYSWLEPAIPHAEWLFILLVIAISAQWGIGSGIISALLSSIGFGIVSHYYGGPPFLDIVIEVLVTFGYFASSALIIGTLSRHKEIAWRARAQIADELENTYEATILALTQALDARDHNTEGHSRRVTDLALKIGRDMGLSETDLRYMQLGALLHDVGKIGIPDAILHKPGALDEAEWKLMRQHPKTGYNILREINFLKPALDIVLSHHERYDGKGYPAGLAGETIPLMARIVAVADAYDALTSNRPYRPAFTHEEALNEIRKNSGRQFDPAVVQVFEKYICEIEEYSPLSIYPSSKQ